MVMLRTRAILLALSAALSYGQYVLLESNLNEGLRYVLHGAGVILSLAAISILLFSFVRIGRTADGQPCFDPLNPYWKLMREFFGETWGDRIRLCKSYWLTVMFISLCVAVLAIVAAVVLGSGWTILQAVKVPGKVPLVLGIVVGIVVASMGLVAFGTWLTEKFPKIKYLWGTLGVALAVAFLVIMPIGTIRNNRDVSVATASSIYMVWLVGIVAAIGAVVFLIWAVFKYLPVLKNTWLGQLFGAIIGQFCPTLVACPCGKQTENSPVTT